jgi:N-methylhydantoinase A
MTPAEAARNPVYGVLSGPSGGVAGALYVASRAGFPNVLTFDMGGTSTDVSLCQAGEPTIGRETTIGQFRIKVPSVDVHTVGAGGGSIAHVPELTGALRVGPQSAGAEPGPAAYGQGVSEPTVTDANVVLGHLPADLIGGEMSLDVEAARAAVGKVADAMGLSLEAAADGILRIVNENMAGALRVISVQRGHDPREFAMVAFGGAGPLHANAVAELMGSFPVIVPPSPGLLCALGDLVAGFRNEFAQTLIRLTADASDEELRSILGGLEARAREWMDAQGIAAAAQHVEFVADMRYRGQGYEIAVPWGEGLDERFNALHEQAYGFRMPNTASEIVNLRAVGTGDRPEPELPVQEPREAAFGPGTYARADLHPGARIAGPSIVTEFDSTTVVLEGYTAEIDRFFNLLIRPEAS